MIIFVQNYIDIYTVVFHVFLRPLCQKVLRGLLLEYPVAYIGFIGEDVFHPFRCQGLPLLSQDPVLPQPLTDLPAAFPLHGKAEDEPNRLSILIRDKPAVYTVIAQDTVAAEIVFPSLIPFPVSPLHVVGDGFGLVLGNDREEGEHHGAGRL